MNHALITVKCENENVLNEVSKYCFQDSEYRKPGEISGQVKVNYTVPAFYETLQRISSKYPECKIEIKGTDEADCYETTYVAKFAGGIVLDSLSFKNHSQRDKEEKRPEKWELKPEHKIYLKFNNSHERVTCWSCVEEFSGEIFMFCINDSFDLPVCKSCALKHGFTFTQSVYDAFFEMHIYCCGNKDFEQFQRKYFPNDHPQVVTPVKHPN